MRRGVGVAHVQKKTEIRQQMTDLGAQITAERVGQIADEIESFEKDLRALAEKYKNEIKHNPAVRAHFRQLADSLGIDLLSSKKNLFSGMLGLGDFYYELASKVVQTCMKERKFCGSYIPFKRIVFFMKKQYEAMATDGKHSKITEEDVRTALDKLRVLGAGYNIVKLAGVSYIQTTPDGVYSSDDALLLSVVLEQQALQIADFRSTCELYQTAKSGTKVLHQLAYPLLGTHHLARSAATRVEADHNKRNYEDNNADVLPEIRCVALTQKEVERRLMWQPHRVHAALERMVQNGSMWIEMPQQSMTTWEESINAEIVYWFIDFILHDNC